MGKKWSRLIGNAVALNLMFKGQTMFSRIGEIHAQISLMPRLVLITKPLFLPFKVKNFWKLVNNYIIIVYDNEIFLVNERESRYLNTSRNYVSFVNFPQVKEKTGAASPNPKSEKSEIKIFKYITYLTRFDVKPATSLSHLLRPKILLLID